MLLQVFNYFWKLFFWNNDLSFNAVISRKIFAYSQTFRIKLLNICDEMRFRRWITDECYHNIFSFPLKCVHWIEHGWHWKNGFFVMPAEAGIQTIILIRQLICDNWWFTKKRKKILSFYNVKFISYIFFSKSITL